MFSLHDRPRRASTPTRAGRRGGAVAAARGEAGAAGARGGGWPGGAGMWADGRAGRPVVTARGFGVAAGQPRWGLLVEGTDVGYGPLGRYLLCFGPRLYAVGDGHGAAGSNYALP